MHLQYAPKTVQIELLGGTETNAISGSIMLKMSSLEENCLIPYRGMGGLVFSLINFQGYGPGHPNAWTVDGSGCA